MISFVVPAYNEERLLGATLDAIHGSAQGTGEPYEIVVADDDSTDGTGDVARRHGARVVRESHRQIAATRNAGARAARGDLLIFVDADTIVNETVVRAAIDTMRGGAVGGGAAVRFDGRVPLYARLILPLIVRGFRVARLAAGCFVFCTRGAFDAVGGFDESMYGAEEIALSRALRRRGRFVVLSQSVLTSGRKLRAHSAGEVLGLMGRLLVKGPGAVRDRRALAIWYHGRREDPDAPGTP